MAALAMLLPLAAQNERELNELYRDSIVEHLRQDVAAREQTMQKRAEQWLVSLPNNEKLYDESFLNVSCSVVANGESGDNLTLDLVYLISYNCRNAEGYSDDYPTGTYDVDSSNSCRAICSLTKTFVESVLADYFRAGKRVTVGIYSSADGSSIGGAMPYDGRYGEYRYVPSTFNDEQLRLSLDKQTGIVNNAQLAYLRAQAVRYYLENNVKNLQRTVNEYRYVTRSYADTGSYYRRSSIVLTVHDAFRETIEMMTADKIQDAYVDFNIPKSLTTNENAFVLIIANENYTNVFLPTVPYAKNDGETMRRYFVSALGVPERQVKVLNNASREQIVNDGVHWLTDLAQAVARNNNGVVEPQADIFIYFAGHGYTDFNNVTYLIPNRLNVEGIKTLKNLEQRIGFVKAPDSDPVYDITLKAKESAKFTFECISVDALCSMFKGFPVKNLTLIIDASMNGQQRNGAPMLRANVARDGKGVKRKANMRADAVVLMAAAPDKTAYSFDAQHHGFLTYFLAKEIKGAAGNLDGVTYQDIYEAVARKLGKESALQGRWQEVYGLAGGKYKDSWSKLKVK